MKDLKYDCYKRDRLHGATAAYLAKVFVNHEGLEKRFQAEFGKKGALWT